MPSYQFFSLKNGEWRLTTTENEAITNIHEGSARFIAVEIVKIILGNLFTVRKK